MGKPRNPVKPTKKVRTPKSYAGKNSAIKSRQAKQRKR